MMLMVESTVKAGIRSKVVISGPLPSHKLPVERRD
jgi:hypothetical protein